MKRRFPRFEVAFGLLLLAAYVLIATGSRAGILFWYRSDDAYYYFQTARNIGRGLGSTFDGIGRTNGYHPLWMAICVPVFLLSRPDPWLPLRVLVVISGGLNALSGVLIYRMVSRRASRSIAATTAVFWSAWTSIHAVTTELGLENALTWCLLAVALYLVSSLHPGGPLRRGEVLKIAVVLALLVLSRLDTVFVVAMLGFWVATLRTPYRSRLQLVVLIVAFSMTGSVLLRLGPIRVPPFKAGITIVLVAALAVKTPILLLFPPRRGNRLRDRAASALLAGVLSSVALMLLVGFLRWIGIPSFPALALVYDLAITCILLFLVEAYLHWIGATAVPPLEALRDHGADVLVRGSIVFGVVGLALAAYGGWSLLVFHTPIPVSGQVKEWWGTLATSYGHPARTTGEFLGVDPSREAAPLQVPAPMMTLFSSAIPATWFPVVLAGWSFAGLLLMKNPSVRKEAADLSLLPLVVGSALLVWIYGIRGYVNPGEWYWISIIAASVLAFNVALSAVLRFGRSATGSSSLETVVAIALIGIVAIRFAERGYRRFLRADSGPYEALTAELAFLESETERAALIGEPGGGDVAYFIHDRSVMNLDGLANSYDYYRLMRVQAGAVYLQAVGLDYVFAGEGMLRQSEPYLETFQDNLLPLAEFGGTTLYRFLPGTEPRDEGGGSSQGFDPEGGRRAGG